MVSYTHSFRYHDRLAPGQSQAAPHAFALIDPMKRLGLRTSKVLDLVDVYDAFIPPSRPVMCHDIVASGDHVSHPQIHML